MYIKSNELFAGMEFENLYAKISRPVVIADEIRNPDNAGALIRLADNIGASHVYFLADVNSVHLPKMQRVAASSYGNLQWSFEKNKNLPESVVNNCTIIALETTTNATNLFTTELPDNPAFIVGNERVGISDELLNRAMMRVYIPVPGMTRSLNVTHAAAVLFFEWLRQMQLRHG
ncbi:MAG: TrmH family RNA methyltransferase [Bacteroidales bacterium]|nr:TrmH family RNA methyltransferase [Bacteroidales bacterium]